MITTDGRDTIRRFFAGQLSQIAGAMAFGTGSTAETVDDTELDEEVIRVNIASISADLANNRIVFRASVQPGSIATINEIGLYSSSILVSSNDLDRSNVLVARTVLATPETVDPDVVSEVEYSLEINFT
jgi:hypothetical protein